MDKKQLPPNVPPDKRAHFILGGVIAIMSGPAGYLVIPGYYWPFRLWPAFVAGVAAAMLIGLLKELHDRFIRRQRRDFELWDWIYTSAGGIVGGGILVLLGMLAGGRKVPVEGMSVALLVVGTVIALWVFRQRGWFDNEEA